MEYKPGEGVRLSIMTTARYPKAHISQFSITQLHPRNPWMLAWWSFSFPGCGNLMQGRTAKGLCLILWEVLINTNGHVNLGILYSLTGKFELAKQTINTRWFLIYVALYVYAIWDCYRGTVDLNKLNILATRENAPIVPVVIRTWDITFLDKRIPWLAAVWSAFMPGLGYFYVHRVITGIFMVLWTVLVSYMSHCLQAIHLTMTGHFAEAKSIVDMQWLLYLPSMYVFSMYDGYLSAVEYNKLFETEQRRFLRKKYQDTAFRMPL